MGVESFIVFLHYLFIVHGISSDKFSSTFDISNCVFSLSLSLFNFIILLARGFSVLLIFGFVDFLYSFAVFNFIAFSSGCYYSYSSPCFRLKLLFLSCFLKRKLRKLILDRSYFLIHGFNSTNHPPSTVFTT